ncbi:family 43 glycosylhydrolase [Agromyces sp. PvR057]|uniref:family 43 glycosylhydrolase n=1 Tax=Agromyces sp. PvR057 TaxID=3156403 RepID=UPI003392B0C0
MTSRTRLAIAMAAATTALALATTSVAAAAPPTTTDPPEYTAYPAVSDPGASASGYFQPYWFDDTGTHIQAHGGQIVTAEEDGRTVYYWYGEDRSNDYYDSPGVAVYKSYDSLNWENQGVALRSVSSKDQLLGGYFDDLYDTVGDDGTVNASTVNELYYHLNVENTASDGSAQLNAIFERPKVLYNEQTGKWVMWWHSDGSITPGGSSYARSLAAVAVSDSPTGPFKLQGAYRLYNEPTYKTACNQSGAVPGGARDMTVFQDDDGTAYIVYSSEENRSLYIAKLDADYTNLEHTTTTDSVGFQFSADGQYPVIFADGSANAPVAGADYAIVERCGLLEAPATFEHDGKYYMVASGATGWGPNPQTYYTADSMLGSWIRGVESDDAYENVQYNQIPEGGDGLLSIGDARKTSFGSQSTNVFALDAGAGEFVYMGDRWNAGAANSTYVWLPMTFGENGRLEMRNPSAESAEWKDGWTAEYWRSHGGGGLRWSVVDDGLPETARTNVDLGDVLPSDVTVRAGGVDREVGVTWNRDVFTATGAQRLTGTLDADDEFAAGRTFTRTIDVVGYGEFNIAPQSTVTVSSRPELASALTDGSNAKGWDDWSSTGTHPKSSWLAFAWNEPRVLDRLVLNTYKDGTASWPSKVGVSYRDPSGTWVDGRVSVDVAQDASGPAPVVELDLSSLPVVSQLRVDLRTTVNVWQAVTEVEIQGYAPSDVAVPTGLSVDGDPIAGFEPDVHDYTVPFAGSGYPEVTVETAGGAEATVEADVDQASASRPWASVAVRALDGSTVAAAQGYRVSFRAPSTDASLSGISIDGTTLGGFSSTKTEYADLPIRTGQVPVVAATSTNAGAKVVVGEFAGNRVVVKVTAEDGSVRTYTLGFVVDDRSRNASLTGITVNGAAVAGFTPNTTSYTVDVGDWGTVPEVGAAVADATSKVTVSSDLAKAVITVQAEHPDFARTYTVAFTASGACPAVAAPWRSTSWGTAGAVCQADGGAFRVTDSNVGAWTNKDTLTHAWQPERLAVGGAIETTVAGIQRGSNSDPRAGLIVRNDLSATGRASAAGYAILVASATGAYLQNDANGNGYIDAETTKVTGAAVPVQLRLERTSATTLTGSYRHDDSEAWKAVGTVTLARPDAKLDAGVYATGNNGAGASTATFVGTHFSDDLAEVDAVEGTTVAFTAPVLPATVTARQYDGVERSLAVAWDDIDPASYAAVGEFAVHGTVTGTALRATANVTVTPLDAATAVPAVGVLEHDNGWDTGLRDGAYNVTMNLWWGQNASIFRLFENGVLMSETPLAYKGLTAQKAVVPIAGKANGTYVYTGELVNGTGVTATKPVTVTVRDASPGTPALSHDNHDKDGAFTVTADLWWGTNATSYEFFENGVRVGAGELNAATPAAQRAKLPVTGKAPGTYEYTVTFTNAAGSTTSAALKVTVAK